MNMFRLVIALVFLAVGLLVGVLNTQPITLDFLFAEFTTSSGAAIIVSLLAGVLIGGLIVVASLVLPMYAKLRKATRAQAAVPPVSSPPASPGNGI